MIKKDCKEYIEEYIGRELTKEEVKKIEVHMRRFNLQEICAWYSDWKDYCSDWCDDIGYTKTEARKRLHSGVGEFQVIDTIGIIRFTI